MATKLLLVGIALLGFLCQSSGRPQRRGSCLLLCGDFNKVTCPSGYTCKSNGCGSECFNTSFVQPQGCPLFDCDSHCPLGFKRDQHGCQSCECDYSALQVGK
ncbi:hypothetical protein V1264_005460 [Littorina saxatilis]|uniref:Antistasin-like domain-containing protein n=2 Tax=Littorina saxatilis TaxID=31220 RepID=A0AAN9G6Z3_9CAEN